MAKNIQRRNFIILILSEMLSYMGLEAYPHNSDNVTLIYYHGSKVKVVKVVKFEKLLRFCGLDYLVDKYSFLHETAFFQKLTECKYFNPTIFRPGNSRDTYKQAKEQKLNTLFTSFVNHVSNNRLSLYKNPYIFTIHERMHLKAIDYFFVFNTEETLALQAKAIRDSLLSPETVREYILEDKGKNYFIPDGAVEDCINELIDSVVQVKGNLENYLREVTANTVKKDILNIYNYYVMRDYYEN